MIQPTDLNISVSGMSLLGKPLWHLFTFIGNLLHSSSRGVKYEQKQLEKPRLKRQREDLHKLGTGNHSAGHTAWPFDLKIIGTMSTYHHALPCDCLEFLPLVAYLDLQRVKTNSWYYFISNLTWIFCCTLSPFTPLVAPFTQFRFLQLSPRQTEGALS